MNRIKAGMLAVVILLAIACDRTTIVEVQQKVTVNDTSHNGGGTTPTGTASIVLSPPGGSFLVGWSIAPTVTCKDASGATALCSGVTLESSNTGVVQTPANTATIICFAAGAATVTVRGTVNGAAVSNSYTFTCTSNPTLGLNQTGPLTLHTAANCPAATLTVSTVGGVLANWTSSNTVLLPFQGSNTNVSQVSFLGTVGQSGSSTVTATAASGATASVVVNLDNTACSTTGGTVVVSLPSLTVNNCAGFVSSYTPTISVNGTNVSGTWTSSNTGVAVATSNGFTLTGTAGTANITVTVANVGSVVIPITVNTCPASGTITVTPNPLNLVLGNLGTATATQSSGVTGNVQWTSTNGCGIFGSPNSLQTSVQGARVCRDSLVITMGNTKGFTILNVTSAASSCTWSRHDGSAVYNNFGINMQFQADGSCVYQGTPQQPYWYSTDPSRFTVVGAPFACTIAGVVYPCGPNATIKAIFAGTADVCNQAAVQDLTVKFCRTLTAVVGGVGDRIPSYAIGIELDVQMQLNIRWPSHAAPAGARIERMVPMADYYKSVQAAQLR